MSHITRRFITDASVAGNLYSSNKGKLVKDYLEQEGLKAWAAKTPGIDDAGAETANVVSAGHSGGTIANEPFHLGVHVTDKHGSNIRTMNPHTNQKTNTWHAYLANSKEELYAIAKSWKKQSKK